MVIVVNYINFNAISHTRMHRKCSQSAHPHPHFRRFSPGKGF